MCLRLCLSLAGDTEWLPGQELPLSPWDLVRKPLSQCITIRLKGTNLATGLQLGAKTKIRATITNNKCHLLDEKALQISLDAFVSLAEMKTDLPTEPHSTRGNSTQTV